MSLPAGPRLPPWLQTLRWLVRPIAFLEASRREFGDAFSVRFLGFERPMVMLSDPETVRALYTAPEHTLPPGRTLALRPIMGPRSVLLLEGREHLARRRLMLPPFHGQRMRAYESIVRDVVASEVERWPEGEPFALHPRMQRVTLEVILRAVFGVTDPARRSRLAEHLGRLLTEEDDRVPAEVCAAVISVGSPSRARAVSDAARISVKRSTALFDATLSEPSPIASPARRIAASGANPCPSFAFENGQCATRAPRAPISARSASEARTQWISSGPPWSAPMASRY